LSKLLSVFVKAVLQSNQKFSSSKLYFTFFYTVYRVVVAKKKSFINKFIGLSLNCKFYGNRLVLNNEFSGDF